MRTCHGARRLWHLAALRLAPPSRLGLGLLRNQALQIGNPLFLREKGHHVRDGQIVARFQCKKLFLGPLHGAQGGLFGRLFPAFGRTLLDLLIKSRKLFLEAAESVFREGHGSDVCDGTAHYLIGKCAFHRPRGFCPHRSAANGMDMPVSAGHRQSLGTHEKTLTFRVFHVSQTRARMMIKNATAAAKQQACGLWTHVEAPMARSKLYL